MFKKKEKFMPSYECGDCGMGIQTLNCSCGSVLVHESIVTEEGETVQVSQCPSGHGKIKSPTCCGADMNPST